MANAIGGKKMSVKSAPIVNARTRALAARIAKLEKKADAQTEEINALTKEHRAAMAAYEAAQQAADRLEAIETKLYWKLDHLEAKNSNVEDDIADLHDELMDLQYPEPLGSHLPPKGKGPRKFKAWKSKKTMAKGLKGGKKSW